MDVTIEIITVIGVVLAVPFLILPCIVWVVGSAIAFLAIGSSATRTGGSNRCWSAPLTLTGIGGLVTFGVGAAGFGAVLRAYLA